MASYQITRLEKSNGAITRVGSMNWITSANDVIKWIESKEHTFYAIIGTNKADIYVKKSDSGTKYLTTNKDGHLPNSLEELIVNRI